MSQFFIVGIKLYRVESWIWCDYQVRGETEDEIFKNGVQHPTKDHGMKEEDLTPGSKKN